MNQFSATTYNISVRSHSDYGEGGLSSIIAETDIGIPEPIPPQPTVLTRNRKTISIEIPPLINNNGPITTIQVFKSIIFQPLHIIFQ